MEKDNNVLNKRQLNQQRNDANNAQNVKALADVASKSANPYAKAIGGAVKAADKISGGKASQKLGKTLTKANKMAPGGRIAQKLLNKSNESGTSSRIANAMSKKNSMMSSGVNKPNNTKSNVEDSTSSTSPSLENDEKETAEGFVNFKIPKKVIQVILIASPAVLTVIIFLCLFMSASQTYINIIGIGSGDSASSSEIDTKIEGSTDEERNEEITDEEYDTQTEQVSTNYNVTIERKKYAIPYLLVDGWTELERENNEADLSELEDYFGGYLEYDENSNMETVNKFYYKLHDIYVRYSLKLGVELDLPLLMSTLMIPTKDMNEVFVLNTKGFKHTDDVETAESHDLDYDKDWSGYKIIEDDSSHDIEILAQNMVSVDEDGSYKIDYDKYENFLEEFLEKKYFIAGGGVYNVKPDVIEDETSDDSNDESDKDGNYVKNVTYTDSSFGKIIYYNQGDYYKYYYSSNPKKAQFKQDGKYATISSHGCGPTALAIVVSSILNKEITPIKTTAKVCSLGGCTSSGSRYTGIINAAKKYGIKTTTTSNNQKVIDALSSKNSLVIVLMGPGTFTSGGHFIVLTGVNKNGNVSVADPGNRIRTKKKWYSFNTIVEQRKTYAPYMIFTR